MDNMEYAENIQDEFDLYTAGFVKLQRELRRKIRRKHGVTYPRERSSESEQTRRPHHMLISERTLTQRGRLG